MSEDKRSDMKSSFELAMERMAAKEEGLVKLSDEQKKRLAEVAARTKAKIAEVEILHGKAVAAAEAAGDAEKVAKLREEMGQAIRKVKDTGEAERAKIRAGR